MLIIAQSRGIIFGFLAGSFFILKDYKKTFKIIIFIIIFLSLIYFLNFFNFREIFNNKFLLDYFALIKLIISIFTENLSSADTFIGTGLESMYWRAESWHKSIGALENNYLLIFGKGGSSLYEESIIIRVITTYGIIGTLLILYLIRKLPLFFIVFLLVTGFTIDLFISFKIFLFTCLFLIIYFKNKKEIIRR